MAGLAKSRIWLNSALRLIGSFKNAAACPTSISAVPEICGKSWNFRWQSGVWSGLRSPGAVGMHFHAPWRSCGFAGAVASNSVARVESRRSFASKLKNPKIKAYSSYKLRFRPVANGLYKRWKAGKRHNAHSKSNKQQRQLRRPSVAPPGLAKAMKYLNFQG